jgi:oligosaccharide repeat unit polymerase
MLFFVWIFFLLFYIAGTGAYLLFSPFEPLGALQYDDSFYYVLLTVFIGALGVFSGYLFLSKINLPRIRGLDSKPFLGFASILYLLLGVVVFFVGVQYYGGYLAFISSPYIPIFGGSAENEIKDTLISTSGLLIIFSVISFLSSAKDKEKRSLTFFLYGLAAFVLLSIFIQGRRENVILLIMTFLSFRFFNGRFDAKKYIRLFLIFMLIMLFAGVGLYLREASSTSGGTVVSAMIFAVLFETHFTVATLANELYNHLVDGQPYAGFLTLLNPVFFIIPSFLFSIIGENKQDLFINTDQGVFESKGGSFIFAEAFHSSGFVGVFLHGVLLGLLLMLFYRSAKRTGYILYHFPIVSLLLVAIRKDITYGVKYISLMYLLLFVFYFIHLGLSLCFPKKM